MTLNDALKCNYENWRIWDNYLVVRISITMGFMCAIFSSLGLCPWRAYVVTQGVGICRHPRPRRRPH